MTVYLDLTDEEWMSIIDMERDGLPYCCGNVSALRDQLTAVARYGGEITFGKMPVVRALCWVEGSHDLTPVIKKIKEQLLADDECLKWYTAMQNMTHADYDMREREGHA